jgi:hypothetical protein
MFDKRKWLTRLNQKVMEMGRAAICSALVIHKSPGREQAPNPMKLEQTERGNPVSLPSGTTDRKACLWRCGFGMSEEANAGS